MVGVGEETVQSCREQLDKQVAIIHAKTIQEATALLGTNQEFAAIAFYSGVLGEHDGQKISLSTAPLITSLKDRQPKCPMVIGVAVFLEFKDSMEQCGCTHTISAKNLPKFLHDAFA